MRNGFEPLTPASLSCDADGVLVSPRYGDIYHARAGAWGQARHVFLGGNRLPQRWQGRASFTVCETGFGTGTNFLALWHAWRNDPDRCTRLHVLAFEAHPFTADDMQQLAQRCDPALHALAQQLADAWPVLTPGVHRLDFEASALTLTLVFGAIERTARQAEAWVDAFFLDGFAPNRNPAMWTPALFGQLRRMAVRGATLGTWCSAAAVRKALSDAGFLVSRAPGFAQKRDMTVAILRPHLGKPLPDTHARHVLIAGAGFAGAAIAHALSRRGHHCTLADPALAHSAVGIHQGHHMAALSPLLTPDDDIRTRLCRTGVLLGQRLWGNLPDALARPVACGTLIPALTPEAPSRLRTALAYLQFPPDWVHWVDAAHARQLAGLPLPHGGLFFPQGRMVRPMPWLAALMQNTRRSPAVLAQLRQQADATWVGCDPSGAVLTHADMVVLACAAAVPPLLATAYATPEALPRMQHLQRLAGQVSYFQASARGDAPRCILAGHGYWLPADANRSTGGSTYVKGAAQAVTLPEAAVPYPPVYVTGHAHILEKLHRLSGVPRATLQGLHIGTQGWSGWRAALADHLPVIGSALGLDGVWAACAFGSRGLAWSALAAELIASRLSGEPLPLERDLYRRIAPR